MISVPAGLSYLPYQLDVVKHMQEHNRTMLVMPIGSGKSVMTCGYLNATHSTSVLILAPVYMLKTWERELRKWLVYPYDIKILNKKSNITDINNKILLVNYESLAKYNLHRFHFQTLVADESQYIKSYTAKRSKAFHAIRSADCFLLTATPIFNKIVELFSPFNKIQPGVFRSHLNFQIRYCDAGYIKMGTKQIWYNGGKSNMDELRTLVRAHHMMIYRKREDILSQLPKLTIQDIQLDMKFTDGTWYKKLSKIKDKEERKKYIEDGMVNTSEDSLFAVRKRLGISKVPSLIPIIEDILESKEQILIFCIHREVTELLKQSLVKYNPLVVHGELDKDIRQNNVDMFISDKSRRILIGTMKAMGAGLTIVNTDTVLFAEIPFTNSDFEQAYGRAYRIGQENPVNVYNYLCPDSLDGDFWDFIQTKKELNQEVLDFST